MSVSIAEYLGQRVDVIAPRIRPSMVGAVGALVPTCPFSGGLCSKLDGRKPYPPVCSVRANGELFVVCSDRLVPAKARVLTASHLALLGDVTSLLMPGADEALVGFRRQVGVTLNRRMVFLDYVIALNDPDYSGRRAVILEIQGGGETSNTGTISRHVQAWSADKGRTNAMLGEPLPRVGIIPNNAWKRQLEQIFRKAPLAGKFGGAFGLVMGPKLFDYVHNAIGLEGGWFPDWEIALIEIKERTSLEPGPVPVESGRAFFMKYSDFVSRVSSFEIPEDASNPLVGDFSTLYNENFRL